MTFPLRRRIFVRFFVALACAFVASALLAGCASDRAIRAAEAALAAARDAHADYLSPGEYRSAENWLAEAHVRMRAADHGAAQSYAEYAESLAGRAMFNAKQFGMNPHPDPTPPASQEDDGVDQTSGQEP